MLKENKDDGNKNLEESVLGVADKILRRNVLNIVRKVQDGKTLSSTELAVVQGFVEQPDNSPTGVAWVQNQTSLARELGVNRKTIQRWIKIEGCPVTASDGRYNVTEWRTWAKNNNFKVADEGDDDDDETKLKLEAKRLLLINQKLEFDLAVKRGEYTNNDDVETMFVMMVQNAKKVLLALPSNASPQVVGLSVPEAEIRLREIVDEALAQLQRQWTD